MFMHYRFMSSQWSSAFHAYFTVAGLEYSLNPEIKELHHALRNEKISY